MDAFNALLAGVESGRNLRLSREAEQRRNQFAQLAGQAYSAAPDQRQPLIGQAVQVDPQAGLALDQTLRQSEEGNYARLGNMSRLLVSAPEQFRPGVYQRMLPDLRQMGLQAPDQYTPEVGQLAEQLAQTWGGGGDSNLPSSVREAMAFRADPSLLETRRQMYGSYSYGEVDLGDGTKGQTRRNSRTGEMELVLPGGRIIPLAGATPAAGGPAPAGAPAAPQSLGTSTPRMDSIVQAANAMRAAGIPTEQIDAWAQQVASVTPGVQVGPPSTAPAASAAPQPLLRRPDAPLGGGFGRPPEEQAALDEAAKRRTALQFADEETRVAAERARLVKEGEAQAAAGAEAAKKGRQNQDTIQALQEAIRILPNATGGRFNALGDATVGLFGVSTQGAQATAQLRLLAAKLVGNVPRFEGPQSNIDVQFYKEAAGDLANENAPVETRLAAARKMLELALKYEGGQSGGQTPAGSAPAIGQIEDGYRFKGGDPADPASWERL